MLCRSFVYHVFVCGIWSFQKDVSCCYPMSTCALRVGNQDVECLMFKIAFVNAEFLHLFGLSMNPNRIPKIICDLSDICVTFWVMKSLISNGSTIDAALERTTSAFFHWYWTSISSGNISEVRSPAWIALLRLSLSFSYSLLTLPGGLGHLIVILCVSLFVGMLGCRDVAYLFCFTWDCGFPALHNTTAGPLLGTVVMGLLLLCLLLQ